MNVLDAKQAAVFLQIHYVTLIKLAKRGLVPCAKVGRKWLFYKEHLIDHLRGTEVEKLSKSETAKEKFDIQITASKNDYLQMLGITDCPQTHSPKPALLRGASHAQAVVQVAKGKAVGLVVNSGSCQNRQADDVRA